MVLKHGNYVAESTAIIEPGAVVSSGCYIGHYTLIRAGAVIGKDSEVRAFCFIAPQVKIGRNVKIMQYSNIGQGTRIANDVYIGAKCMITNTNRIKHGRPFGLVITPCEIGYAARIASGVTLLPGVCIGDNALIGAGSLVTKSVPKGEVWMGHPAKFVREVSVEELL